MKQQWQHMKNHPLLIKCVVVTYIHYSLKENQGFPNNRKGWGGGGLNFPPVGGIGKWLHLKMLFLLGYNLKIVI